MGKYDKQLVHARCEACDNELIVLDTDKHGWNGFVCGDECLDRNLPLEQYICPEGEDDTFEITVTINSEGKDDFIENIDDEEAFKPEDWVNGFGSISIAVKCAPCDFEEDEWTSFETM